MVWEMVACPSISWTPLGLTFFLSSRVAQVWRRLWNVNPESPAFYRRALKSRW
jgi:hypothetical protein